MGITDRLLKNTTIKQSEILSESKFFTEKDMIQTPVPAINIALSGSLNGGLTPGLLVLAAPSKHYKSGMSLLMAASYMEKYPDSALLFYDSEFGIPQNYFDTFGIDTNRVIHTPITDVEQLKHDIMHQLGNIEKGDKVIIIIDSIGNLASKKEVDDTLEGKTVADMTRAKQMKSLWRMVTPHLTMKDIPCIAINHVYSSMGMFPTAVVAGGTGGVYSASTIWIIGRRQEKEGTDISGYNFVINVEKSRYVREKSSIPINISFDTGIQKWSGLMEIALESGHVIKPSKGWYQRLKPSETQNLRLKDTHTEEFWKPILEDPEFNEYVESHYKLAHNKAFQQ